MVVAVAQNTGSADRLSEWILETTGSHDLLALGLQPYPQKVVGPPWHPPQPPSQEVVGALR